MWIIFLQIQLMDLLKAVIKTILHFLFDSLHNRIWYHARFAKQHSKVTPDEHENQKMGN